MEETKKYTSNSNKNNKKSELTIKMALHLRWLTTEKFLNYETVKGGCIPSKNKFITQKYNKLRWLTSDTYFKQLHTGCPNAHDKTKGKRSFPPLQLPDKDC